MMKIKNLIPAVTMMLAALATPFAGRAEVSGGDIYSVDLSTEYRGVIPAPGTTLTIGERVTVRIRLINRKDSAGNWTDWRFVENGSWTGSTDPTMAYFAPALGLMLGGQQVFATFIGSKQVYVGEPKANTLTDLYFQYTVKSGDLALPARFMSTAGTGVSSDTDNTDYAIQYCNYLGAYWRLSNNNGDACNFHFCDKNPTDDPDPSYEAGLPNRFITGTELGINVKTVDFDTDYYKQPSMPGVDDGVWRQLYVGLETALPAPPTVKVDGLADVAATMYVWVDNADPADPVAEVLASDNPEQIFDPKDPTKYRWVIKVPIAKGAGSANFKLKGVREGKVKVRMSASRELSYNGAGDLLADWVERNVSVVPPPDPYVMADVLNSAGDPLAKNTVQLTADYENPAAMFRFTLLQEPSADLTVKLVPELAEGDIFDDGLLGLSLTTEDAPWLNEDLEFTVKKGDPLTKTVYVYAKGTTKKLKSAGVKFTIETSGAPEYDGESGKHSFKLLVNDMKPLLVKPAKGDAITDAMAGKNYSLDITISDARKHMVDAANGDAAYTAHWKVEAPGTEGEWDSDDAVCLDDADSGEATISVPFDIEGECTLRLYVVSPSGQRSAEVAIPVTVAAPKRATVTLDRESGVYAEGETAYVNFHLTQKYKNELYAFLVPQDDETKAKFETDISSETAGAIGYYIGPNETDTKIPTEIRVVDGKAIGRFQVFMCTTKNYSKTKSGGYIGDVFTVSSTNVVPLIKAASMGGQDIKTSGGVTKTVAQNVEKTFRLTVDEPGQLDLDATGDDAFLTQWKFGTGDWVDMKGNPNIAATQVKHAFTSPGDQEVTVRCQDKDMRKLGKWSEEFTFTVPVLDIPKVVITPVQDRRQYFEDETGSDYGFKVELTAAPDISGSERLNVEIRKELVGDASKYSIDDLVLSKDAVTFAGGTATGPTFFLRQLDGTSESAAAGFRLVAHVTNPEIDTEGKTWDDGEIEIYIVNRAPTILNPTERLDKDGNPVATVTSIGIDNTLAWSLKDVAADTNRMTVTWETSEGARKTYRQGDPGWDSVMSGTHTFSFASAGEKSITMTALDKDGESVSRTFYYFIEPSKVLKLIPHGPTAGKGTPLSKRYRSATGIGEGRVYSKNPASIEGFQSVHNCGLDKTWTVYAYGYKVGESSGDVKQYPERENKIDADGNADEAGGYAYADAAKDSFLYTWIQIYRKGGDGTDAGSVLEEAYLNGSTAPEYPESKDVGVDVVLPAQALEDGTYDDTILEAVFSKELYAQDNVGDINQDGIPDVVVDKYGFGIVDETGKMKGNDLDKLHGYNEDEDYLPSTETAQYGSLIPALPADWVTLGMPFDAKTEIRGYHDGLNDAFASPLADGTVNPGAIAGVKPERVYEADGAWNKDKCTISELEYRAWCRYAEKNGLDKSSPDDWTKWSPERPTDPTMADTDEDAYPDGYEYFFWYRAHVGYLEGGRLVQLTGRRYNPVHPCEPERITSEEIAELMDPITPCDKETANIRDTDNDGLPDLMEFELGTNPFDFDTDGDGLPDGYEVVISKTSPLKYATNDVDCDADLNVDGDGMAFFSYDTEDTLYWVAPVICEDGQKGYICSPAAQELKVVETEPGVTNIVAVEDGVYTAWLYKRGGFAEKREFCRGRTYWCPDTYTNLVVTGEVTREVMDVIHFDVYHEFGFDPRTGWNFPIYWVGHLVNGREFTVRDEFLTQAFFYHKGGLGIEDLTPTREKPWATLWEQQSTSPGAAFNEKGEQVLASGAADTDSDGMPDGWELYMMAGAPEQKPEEPSKGADLAPRPRCSPRWMYGPLESFEKIANTLAADPDGDGLDWPHEYSGVESCDKYADCPTITLLQPGWQNKWWPTDPWAEDTDGDGLKDGEEGDKFVYGSATHKAADFEDIVPGGGLNPLSWDTDCDGLPDPWEDEFAGTPKTTPASSTTTVSAEGVTNTTLVAASATWNDDGMDGTVHDSMKDYDRDGLANWQEYMVGAMRCWRYDDTVSPWVQHKIPLTSSDHPSDSTLYEILANWEGAKFNPGFKGFHFSPAVYFSCANNAFEQGNGFGGKVYGHFYMFKDGIYHDLKDMIDDHGNNRYTRNATLVSPGGAMHSYQDHDSSGLIPIYPQKYICCDPRLSDTDFDGLDDYYELFHGLNPILGESTIRWTSAARPARDIIYEAYYKEKQFENPWSAEYNSWLDSGILFLQTRPDKELQVKDGEKNIHDFFQFPWLAGMAAADPDGDNIRNQQEGIFANLQAAATYLHTDPTPLWMTDYSYEDSLVCRYYQVSEPTWAKQVTLESFLYNKDYFEHEGVKYPMSRYPWLEPVFEEGDLVAYKINFDDAFNFWKVRDDMFDYEENEGYDTDHDYLSDFEEAQGKTKTASNPQYHDSPLRRQAMWFGGDEDKGFLETPTPYDEETPYTTTGAEVRQNFLYFTVECWAKPDAATMGREELQTLVERAIWVGPANPADENYLRKNFLIGIKGGRWYAKFDTTGTDVNQPVEITDGPQATAEWTHVAATYDGTALRLYVNGICNVLKETQLQPEHGVSAASVNEYGEIAPGTHEWADKKGREHLIAVLVGASAASWMGISFDGAWQNRNPAGFSPFPNPLYLLTSHTTKIGDYRNFYRGYIDEVRLWDGARTAADIKRAYETRERFTAEMAAQNRDEVFASWAAGARRTPTAPSALPAQLMNHWSFDHLPGAAQAADVLPAPAGFSTLKGVTDAMAPWARPDGWTNCWRVAIDESIQSRVYNDLAWVPWINDTVGHLPLLDGTTLDSVYWSANYAGGTNAAAAGYSSFAFPRTAEAPSSRRQVIYAEGKGGEGPGDGNPGTPYTTFTRWMTIAGNDALKDAYRFSHRNRLRRGFDLMPFGGAFARRISAAEGGMWDDQGAADAWAQTGGDANNDGLPDWWSQYALENYYEGDPTKPVTWDTTVNYFGITMPAYLAYKRDLAKGMLSDGDYHGEYADTRDVDADGLPDWWEELYGVQGYAKEDADADPDNDALSNYAEYLLGEVYPFAYEGIGDIRLLNPKLAHSVTNQLVTDYFLRYSTEFRDVKNAEGKSVFYLNEYFGEIATDHDFMEDWWENALPASYVSAKVYDPLDDKDEDGWSNWAECRAAIWSGSFNAALIDSWTSTLDDKQDKMQQTVANYPKPTIGVRATYHGNQDVSGRQLVIRTISGQTPRVDATFVVPPTIGSQVRYIGPFVGDWVMRGQLSPGQVDAGSVVFYRAKNNTDKAFVWNWTWYDSRQINHPAQTSGTLAEYLDMNAQWPRIVIEDSRYEWESLATAVEKSTGLADVMFTNGAKIGTLDTRTGEYELDLSKTDGDSSTYVYYVKYDSRIGHEWPQSVYVSDTHELDAADGGADSVTGNGRVREGRNTIEAFFDLNANGAYDAGEPFGSLQNVQIGWHKVPEVVIELRDESPVMPCVVVAAAAKEGEAAQTAEPQGADGEAAASEIATSGAATKRVRIIREAINGQSEFDGLRLPERILLSRTVVLDDHPYLTEADVSSVSQPDLDWRQLVTDAARVQLIPSDIKTVTYRVEEIETSDDGVVTNRPLGRFTKEFALARPQATAVDPVDKAPIYSASPTFTFRANDDTATGYRLQVRDAADNVIYDSGVTALPGRTGSTVGVPAYSVTPPIYVGAPVYAGVTNLLREVHPLFADGSNYTWGVTLYNAKYKADPDEWTKLGSFQTDVCNSNRYPRLATGYGNATLAVRYFGPTNVAPGSIVVEAYENADFRGQPMAQVRLGDTNDLQRTDDITVPNVVLRGLKPGQVFFRAYVDRNDDGARANWESWGYANMVGQGFKATYNPNPLAVTVSAADWVVGNKADRVIYIEDTDVNKDELPDAIEDMRLFAAGGTGGGDDPDSPEVTDPSLDTDGDGMPDVWENWNDGITDPDVPDADLAADGDVMAYFDETRYLVYFNDASRKPLLLAEGETYRRGENNKADAYRYTSWYYYGTDDCGLYGVGTNLTETLPADLEITRVVPVTARLVHAQVYARFGYNTLTANYNAFARGQAVNTKPFGALDKLLVLRYLQAIGATPANPDPGKYKDFETYVRMAGGEAVWSKWTLLPGELDYNFDKIDDGWELYVMYGPVDLSVARDELKSNVSVTPWSAIGKSREMSPGGDSLSWSQEYDGGFWPTDPWQVDSDGDGIADNQAYRYLLKGERYREDDDNDGLSNFQEFISSEVLRDELKTPVIDPLSMKTYAKGGQAVPDYFLRVGSLYLGEMLADHDFIEDWLEDSGELFSGDRKASRYRYDAHEDFDGNGWDNWSEARAYLAAPTNHVFAGVKTNVITQTGIATQEEALKIWTEHDSEGVGDQSGAQGYSYVAEDGTTKWAVSWREFEDVYRDYVDYAGRPQPKGRIKVVYNGERSYAGNLVIQSYRYRDGKIPPMTVSADATWIIPVGDKSAWYDLSSPTNGYVCGGKNMFVVYDDADANGSWTPGEPYGIVADVDVGFEKICDSAVEVTDTNPSMVRIDLAAALSGTGGGESGSSGGKEGAFLTDRDANGYQMYPNEKRTGEGVTFSYNASLNANVRVRIVRCAINGRAEWTVNGTVNRAGEVVAEELVNPTLVPVLSEWLVLRTGKLDLDQGSLVQAAGKLGWVAADVTHASYQIVIGNDKIDLNNLNQNNALLFTFVNGFEQTKNFKVPVAEGVVTSDAIHPTFRWTHEGSKRYPFFQLTVKKGTTVVKQFSLMRSPACDSTGVYAWEAPLCVGFELDNNTTYSYEVAMGDAKNQTMTQNFVGKADFRMSANGLGGDVSDQYSIFTAVKYFGPVATNKTIRVEAFDSPDFVGLPAAATKVRNCNYLMTTNSVTVNAQLIGLEAGRKYYVRAFIDSNENGVRDDGESWGYGNYVGSGRRDLYTPRAYVAKRGSFEMPEAVVYIEDVDRDNNGIPDARTDLTAPTADGPYVVSYAGGNVKPVATQIFSALDGDTALLPFVSQLHSFENGKTISAYQLYFAMMRGDVLDLDDLITKSSARVTSFSLDKGIELAVSTRTTMNGKTMVPTVSGLTYEVKLQVKVWHVNELSGTWEQLEPTLNVTVPVNAVDETVDPAKLESVNATIREMTTGASGFFKVEVNVAAE